MGLSVEKTAERRRFGIETVDVYVFLCCRIINRTTFRPCLWRLIFNANRLITKILLCGKKK